MEVLDLDDGRKQQSSLIKSQYLQFLDWIFDVSDVLFESIDVPLFSIDEFEYLHPAIFSSLNYSLF